MLGCMDTIGRVVVRWWRPLAVAGAGVVLLAAPSTARVLAVGTLAFAVWLTVSTARASGASGVTAPPEITEEGVTGDPTDEEARIALTELVHERDASIARAAAAEDREQLARDRLTSLAPLERRIEIAERRALDAERRLDEIDERVDRAIRDDVPGGDTVGEPGARGPSSVASEGDELRARLSKSASRKKTDQDR